jgi:hypothetical protein
MGKGFNRWGLYLRREKNDGKKVQEMEQGVKNNKA